MAAGRAAWVYSGPAGDGWVTPERYPALEADGFRGRATGAVLDAEDFRRGLEAYTPGLGEAARSLAVQHHRDYEHAVALVEALQETTPARPATGAPLRELARTIRAGYDAQVRAEDLLRDLEATHRDLAAARADNARLRTAIEAVTGTRRWRMAQGVARPLDAARRARRRP